MSRSVKPVAWLRGRTSGQQTKKSVMNLDAVEEFGALSNALEAMDCVMADDLERANKILNGTSPKSSLPALARGVMSFIEATLGFEGEKIKEATEQLRIAEEAAMRDRLRAQKTQHQSSSFAPGTEYYLAVAEAHLMGAVVLFLSESAIASVKSFYKLRRAYQILADIYNNSRDENSGQLLLPEIADEKSKLGDTADDDNDPNEDDIIVDQSADTADLESALEQVLEKNELDISALPETQLPPRPAQKFKPFGGGNIANANANSNAATALVDDYIQSGVNLCFGILQLVITMIPPAFGRVLSVIGFRGDRETSLQMLWEATSSDSIHGAIALLTLLMYYTGPAQVCDISPSESSFPKDRLLSVLARTRKRYPRSALWILQEARMLGMDGDLKRSLTILQTPMKVQMRQVEALVEFERGMCHLDLHEFESAAQSFMKLTKLNTWSHALYTYVAGVCYVELYRAASRAATQDVVKIALYKKKAEEMLLIAPTLIGKRRITGRAMPLELYLQRKVEKWKSWMPTTSPKDSRGGSSTSVNSTSSGIQPSIVDYIGTSPANEIIYFWNGYKRMPREALEKSLVELNYQFVASPADVTPMNTPNKSSVYFQENAKKYPHIADIDELGVKFILESIVLRNLGYAEMGLKVLESEVMHINRSMLKGNHKEDWIPPCGMYEKAVFEWFVKGTDGAEKTLELLNKAAHYGYEYVLNTRMGVRIQTGIEVLKSTSSVGG
ncbi:outer membrane protein Iml2/Tetratricopeptide repeat protein 39 [Lipomyces kononenkoae]